MGVFGDLFGENKPKRQKQTKGDTDRILKRQKDKCAICGSKFSARSVVHWDHKRALALGGSDTTRNIQALCPNCHAEKTREDRSKISKTNRKKKEEDPFAVDLFGKSNGGRKKSDPFDNILGDISSTGKPRRRKKKKKDPFNIF